MSHIVVLRPYSYGYKSSSAAKVTYKHGADDSALQTSYSNDLGLVPILSSKDDDKLASPHIVRAFGKQTHRMVLRGRTARDRRGQA